MALIIRMEEGEGQNFFLPKTQSQDFPGGPVVKNPLSNAGDTGSSPGRGTKIPHAAEQLSLHTTTREKPTAATKTRCSQINK